MKLAKLQIEVSGPESLSSPEQEEISEALHRLPQLITAELKTKLHRPAMADRLKITVTHED